VFSLEPGCHGFPGSLDIPDSVIPEAHVHFAEKVAWFDVDEELPRFEGPAAADNNGDWQKL
jgi:hypothetical protein